MKTKNILLLVGVVALVVILFYSFQGSQDDTAYVAEIKSEREKNELFLKTSEESPITKEENFKGLNYYPINAKYRVIANLTPIESRKVITLATSDGKEQQYKEYAYADFTLDGVSSKLLILEGIDIGPIRGKLFLAFGDETSAIETYGAGRYLDVPKEPGSTTITLDFNKAYNPYCAYNSTYSCPLPPAENLIKVPIKAGEKSYH
jgi:uncharacterized protein (DUF1684 family)